MPCVTPQADSGSSGPSAHQEQAERVTLVTLATSFPEQGWGILVQLDGRKPDLAALISPRSKERCSFQVQNRFPGLLSQVRCQLTHRVRPPVSHSFS
jgi:hypothetical protein